MGGICTVSDIVVEIRNQHIEAGVTHTCDRRTIMRVIDRLEQIDGAITTFHSEITFYRLLYVNERISSYYMICYSILLA